MIPTAAPDSGEVGSLTKSLKLLSEELAGIQKSKAFEAELQQTKIADSSTLQCLEQRATVLRRRLLATARKSILQTWQSVDKLQVLLGGLPKATSRAEEEYRVAAIPQVKELAGLSGQVSSGAATIKELEDHIATLAVTVFRPADSEVEVSQESQEQLVRKSEGVNFKDAGESSQAFAKTCNEVALCGKTHVSTVAALCLLRTPNLSAASQEGKELTQKLVGVHKALSSLCDNLKAEIAPGSEYFSLRAFAETVLNEATDCLNPKKSPDESAVAAPAKGKKRKAEEPAEEPKKKEKAEKAAEKKKKTKKGKDSDDESESKKKKKAGSKSKRKREAD